MKKLLFIILLCLSACAARTPQNAAINSEKILVALEPLELLTKTLTQGTPIETVPALPFTYSQNSHARYFKKHQDEFSNKSKLSRACVTIRKIWKYDNLYPYARRHNIRIIEIDASAPIDKMQAGVKLVKHPANDSVMPNIWNSPANLSQMADFVAKDISALFPQYSTTIDANLKKFKRKIFQLRAEFEDKLGGLDSTEVLSLTADFKYLTSEFGIDIVEYFLKDSIDWNDEDLETLARKIRENEIRVVLYKGNLPANIQKTISNNGAKLIALTTLKADRKESSPETRLLKLYSDNLNAICNGLR